MTPDEITKALDTIAGLPPDIVARAEYLVGTLGIKGPIIPELLRMSRAYMAAQQAENVVEAAINAFGEAAKRLGFVIQVPRHHDREECMSAALTAAGIKAGEIEREACATLVEWHGGAPEIAAAIRARGETM